VQHCGFTTTKIKTTAVLVAQHWLYWGVGTAMTETNYDGLGRAMAAQIHGAVEVIVNPGRLPLKQNPLTWNAKPFATVMNYWCLD
jgi:hypothetical protein